MLIEDDASYMNAFQYDVVGYSTCQVPSVISYLISKKVDTFAHLPST